MKVDGDQDYQAPKRTKKHSESIINSPEIFWSRTIDLCEEHTEIEVIFNTNPALKG